MRSLANFSPISLCITSSTSRRSRLYSRPSRPRSDIYVMKYARLLTIQYRLRARWLSRCPHRRATLATVFSVDHLERPIHRAYQIQYRGVKSKVIVSVDELLHRQPRPETSLPKLEDEGPTYPTVVQQAKNNMRQYENCVLLTRVGSFYEVKAASSRQIHMLIYAPALSRPSRQIWSSTQSQGRIKENRSRPCAYGDLPT